MTIVRTPNDSHLLKSYLVSGIREKISEALVRSHLPYFTVKSMFSDESICVQCIIGGDVAQDMIPSFAHPIEIDTPDMSPNKRMVFDARQFGRINASQMQFMVRQQAEFEWAAKRAALSAAWTIDRPDKLRDASPLLASVYSTVLSEVIARRFALELGDKLQLRMLAAWYFFSQFSDERDFDEMGFAKMVGRVATTTKIPATEVSKMFEDCGPIRSIDEFCNVSATRTGNIRLDSLNPGLIYEVIAGIWFGSNSRETICVAVDHPPTWAMIVYGSIEEATFKRSAIAKTVMEQAKGQAGQMLVRSMDNIMDPEGHLKDFLETMVNIKPF